MMRRPVTWFLLLALLLTPVLGSFAPSHAAFAQDDQGIESTIPAGDGTPVVDVTPDASPTDDPSATPDETVTDVPTSTETATETPATPVATDVPTTTPTAEATPTETGTSSSAGVGSPSDITITLKCTTVPAETIRVTNNGSENITLNSIGTLFDPLPAEPFILGRVLKPGKTAIFQAGPGATYGTVLTSKYIFTNTAYDADGVSLDTSVGNVQQTCDPKPIPVDPWVSNPGKLSDLSIVLNCRAYAESIRVTNNGTGYILLKAIATNFDASADEPYHVDRVLKPGATAIYSAGTGAQYGTVLTKDYIFTNSVWEKDGVRISTSAGKAFKSCDAKPLPPEHWVEINLSMQYLWAYEGGTVVNETYVSTGRPGFDTPTGTFYILAKYLYDDMEGVINGEYYNVPAVPWTMYFTNYGHALHGTYWHNNFGHVMSHGCVNLPLGFAEWLYYWLPYGGRVVIHY